MERRTWHARTKMSRSPPLVRILSVGKWSRRNIPSARGWWWKKPATAKSYRRVVPVSITGGDHRAIADSKGPGYVRLDRYICVEICALLTDYDAIRMYDVDLVEQLLGTTITDRKPDVYSPAQPYEEYFFEGGTQSVRHLVFRCIDFDGSETVMPAQAGIQGEQAVAYSYPAWIPAFAGMTHPQFTPRLHCVGPLGKGSRLTLLPGA